MRQRTTAFTDADQAQEKFGLLEERFGDTYTLVDDEATREYNSAGQLVNTSEDTYEVRGVLQRDPDEDVIRGTYGDEEQGVAVFYTDDDRVDTGMRLKEDNGDAWHIKVRMDRETMRDGVEVYQKFELRRADD